MTKPGFGEATRVWGEIGVLSFGGPAAQIAMMHRYVVEERGWLSEKAYLNALSFCMLLPGPEAMQLATYAGWRLHGTLGGLVAGLLFVLPGALVIAALASLYVLYGQVPLVQALFLGVKAAVIVIVIEALLRISKRALKGREHWLIAALAFVALFVFDTPYPLVVAAAAIWGFATGKPDVTEEPGTDAATAKTSISKTLGTIALWLAIWWLPVFVLEALLPGSVFSEIGHFFSVLATVTFGGAYAVLAYMAQEAVGGYGWLTAPEMADALGLAETTPGPLILVTEFVGFLAAARDAGGTPNLWMGLAGAAVTLWVTFVPCFLWIFAGAPYIDRIQQIPRLRNALTAITAAVVGVIVNLSLWFSLQVTFDNVARLDAGIARPWVPDWASFDWRVVVLTALAAVLLLKLHRSVVTTLAITAAVGAGFSLLPA